MSKEMEEQGMTEIVHFAKSKMYAGKTFLSYIKVLVEQCQTSSKHSLTKQARRERLC